ncbi:MAG: discoidin domain-containing protein [Planctomycetes bacterium]|nr:discoidin domain-containing protein [Planctomycetota bacterium]
MGSPNWVAGKFGNALEFDGSSYVDCGNAEALNVNVFSVSFWCNIPSTQGWNHMISRGNHSGVSENWGVMMVSGAQRILYETFDNTTWSGIRVDITLGEWHHIVATYDGNMRQLYYDGVLADSGADGMLLDQSQEFVIGARSNGGSSSDFFIGSIDEVGYFSVVLAPEDIETIMNYGLAEIVGGTAVAANPSPANGAEDVPRDVIFSWEPGEFAAPTNGHKVYFGQSFNNVNDATGGVAQDANSYTPPQRLDFSKTYYWRIDEVNAPPTSQIEFKGEVWSFTTEPFAYPVENITATASSTHQADMGPENTINGSGLDADDLHSIEPADMWLSFDEPNGAWIEYELDKVHKLHEMWVWNSNDMMESFLGFGIKDVTIEYSTNGTDYTTLGTTHEFAQAPGAVDYAHNTTIDFGGVTAKYVRLTTNSNWGAGLLDQYGLSEVRFFYIPVYAREPSPDSGTTDVAVDVTLGFRAGREADTHDVYLSADEQAVIDGNVPVSTVTETNYGPLSLDLGTTYYWKINEVNEAETPTMWQGDIWNFTTHEFFVVDGFEDYNDYPPDEIWSTWVDGYGVATNGATVGYPNPDWNQDEHYVETTIVHGGDQSMPFFYSNTGGATYSEGERTFAVPQDWTKAGVQTLTLYFYGTAGNTGQLYVKVNGSKVVYDGDAGNLARAGWQAWNIDLASFGTNLQSVTTLGIGIDGSGASGTLYFDDIRLYPFERQFITPVDPGSDGLVAFYALENDVLDGSGNGNDGTIVGDPVFVEGPAGYGMAMEFDGDDHVDTGNTEDLATWTIACWAKSPAAPSGDSASGPVHRENNYQFDWNHGDETFRASVSINAGGWHAASFGTLEADTWYHLAGTYDGEELKSYQDGILITTNDAPSGPPNAETGTLKLARHATAVQYFTGTVDEVTIYNSVLSDAEIAWLAGWTVPFDKPF